MLDFNDVGPVSELLERYEVDRISDLFGPDGDIAAWVVRRDQELAAGSAGSGAEYNGVKISEPDRPHTGATAGPGDDEPDEQFKGSNTC